MRCLLDVRGCRFRRHLRSSFRRSRRVRGCVSASLNITSATDAMLVLFRGLREARIVRVSLSSRDTLVVRRAERVTHFRSRGWRIVGRLLSCHAGYCARDAHLRVRSSKGLAMAVFEAHPEVMSGLRRFALMQRIPGNGFLRRLSSACRRMFARAARLRRVRVVVSLDLQL